MRSRFPAGHLRPRLGEDVTRFYGSVPVTLVLNLLLAVVAGFLAGWIGAALVGFGILLLVCLFVVVRYLAWGDPDWRATYGGTLWPTERLMFFEICSRSSVPVDPYAALGAVSCGVRTPSVEVAEARPRYQTRVNPSGVVAQFEIALEPGKYRVRWYASKHRGDLREVTRATIDVPSVEQQLREHRAALGVEPAGEPGENREVGVEPDSVEPSDAEW